MFLDKNPNSFPLIERYFGESIRRLQVTPPRRGRFVYLYSQGDPDRLEARLKRTHMTLSFQTIFDEVGIITDTSELDRRLVDAWAEIRVIDHLLKEGFTDIRKESSIADMTAKMHDLCYYYSATLAKAASLASLVLRWDM